MGSCSFSASAFLNLRYAPLMFFDLVGNSLSFWFKRCLVMYFLSISRVFVFSFSILALQCFADIMFTVPFVRLKSLTFSHVSSIGLVPNSFDSDRINAILVLAFDISMLSFSSVGIFGNWSYRL